MTISAPAADLASTAEQVDQLRRALTDAELLWSPDIEKVDSRYRSSAVNLAHYWAERQLDLRDLQQQLATLGLSSLGRSEPHVRATVDAIAAALDALVHDYHPSTSAGIGFDEGPRLLRRRASELFGRQPQRRTTRIMVTLPSEAATDDRLVLDLVGRGMDLARINCAHDDPRAWAAMIAHVRAAAAAVGRDCRIAMDLSGPKLRTGPLAEGPRVIRLRPRRDVLGNVTTPARCRLVPADDRAQAPDSDLPVLPVDGEWLARRQIGDVLTLSDTRRARRRLVVEVIDEHGACATAADTTYVGTGTVLAAPDGTRTRVGLLSPTEQYLTLHVGDHLVLTRDCLPVEVAGADPAHIGCTLPEAFDHARRGQSVQLDDGRISATIIDTDSERITVQVTSAAINGSRLRAEKGINLPDTVLPVSALTEDDRANLAFIAANADLVEFSFVRSAQDVADLLAALADLGDTRLGIVLKIETAQGFQNLPEILLTAMRRRRVGVMIARGDLAVECGYARLAELQEEILWLCEAAHVPVIWATQVLDRMARSGHPSRAEVTDAAMGVRAECVMLNKGPHILEAVSSLEDILTRMSAHHYKKNALMRPLRSWQSTPSAARARDGAAS